MDALVLWDVDHTLVENAGVSKETYAAAFTVLTGFSPRVPARTEGRTDRLIMRDMFAAHDLIPPDWPAVDAALARAGAQRYTAMQTRGSVLPGVVDVLDALTMLPGVVQSLLTGNIESNARMKVDALGLGRFFDFVVGGYGSDSDDRADLVALAQQRASDAYGCTFDKRNTVLIGDTPRDIEAGATGGAQVLAVASGVHSTTALRDAGTAVIFDDLSDTDRVLDAINTLTS